MVVSENGGRQAVLAILFVAALVLSFGSTTKKPSTPQPAEPGTTSAAAGASGAPPASAAPPRTTAPGNQPPAAKGSAGGAGGPAVGAVRHAPRLTRLRVELPDGVFHGYLYTTPGARHCSRQLPTGRYVRCAIDRGHLRGCGTALFRNRSTVFCKDDVYRLCRVGADGRLKTCGGVFSGWTITQRRGSLRRCCIRKGHVKYCTNDPTYVCTAADRRRTARAYYTTRSYTYRRSPAPLPRRPVRTVRRVRRGSYQKCRIFNGRVSSCFGWYHGYAVVFHNGAYRRCRIFNGQISSCGSWYQGKAVAYRNNAWRLCTIFNGQISHCGTWYRGRAAVWRNR